MRQDFSYLDALLPADLHGHGGAPLVIDDAKFVTVVANASNTVGAGHVVGTLSQTPQRSSGDTHSTASRSMCPRGADRHRESGARPVRL